MPQINTENIYVVYQKKDLDNYFPLCFDNEPEATSYANEMNVRHSYTELQRMDVYKVCKLYDYIYSYGALQQEEGYENGKTIGYEDGKNDC